MRSIVLGAKGQLGKDLVAVFHEEGETIGYDLPELDITNSAAVSKAVEEFGPEMVILAAAYTNVEGAEDDSASAFLVNEEGAANVARASSSVGASMVYYSTDYVFDGHKGAPYEPDDGVAPVGVYGRSKAAGEVITRELCQRHFIVRTAWLYGPGGNNFVEKILAAARTRPSLKVVRDEMGSPTHTEDLAAATLALAKTERYGTYHAVNEGSCSRFEFARRIVELAGLETSVTSCLSLEFPTKAERPLYSVLSNLKFEEATGYTMRSWDEALARYMARRRV